MSRTSWGFPKGKVNKDESAFDCAIREVHESQCKDCFVGNLAIVQYFQILLFEAQAGFCSW